MPETPRTWLLGKWLNGPHRGETMALSGPVPDTPVRAVEKALVDAERERLLDLIERLFRERNANSDIAVGLAERLHHELDDYPAYSGAMDELIGDEDADVEAALREYGRLGKEES